VKRLFAAVALVLAVVLVTGAALFAANDPLPGGGAGGPTPVMPAAPSRTRAPAPALASFYDQHLEWSDCQSGDQCATLTVPLDYRHPSGRTIGLSLLKVPAADPGSRLGSLVINPGGPGEPGTTFAAAGSQVLGRPLLEHFDVVGFDPRGTGDSSPVDCLSDSQLDQYLSENPDPTTAGERSTYRAAQHRMATGCSRLSGALASHVSTAESARDMDILRAALGDGALNYLGFSYGTKLGATYAQLFPHRVGRFVLDGALDVSLGTRQLALQQAGGFQVALEAYAANCVSSSVGCFLGDTVPEVLHAISALLDRVAERPLPAGDRQLTVGDAFYGITYPLYNRSYWLLLTAGLRAALAGDGSVLMQLADLYAARDSDGTFQNNSMEAFFNISCLDDPWSVPASRVPEEFPAFERASPVFGKVFAWSLTSCRGFAPRSDEPVPTIHAKGAAPIVVVGTTRDPATPFAWAVALARQLDSGVLLRRDGDGHTGYHTGNACIDHAVESYLVSGIVPANNTSC
jgi:pimeloyl-ACP methyl ester carboxylesterase